MGTVKELIYMRNEAVHGNKKVSAKVAKEMVGFVAELIGELR